MKRAKCECQLRVLLCVYCFVVFDKGDASLASLELRQRVRVPVDVVDFVRLVVVSAVVRLHTNNTQLVVATLLFFLLLCCDRYRLGHNDASDELLGALVAEAAELLGRLVVYASHEVENGRVVEEFVRQLGAQQQLGLVGGDGGREAVDEIEAVLGYGYLVLHVVVVAVDLLHAVEAQAAAEDDVEQVNELRRGRPDLGHALHRDRDDLVVCAAFACHFHWLQTKKEQHKREWNKWREQKRKRMRRRSFVCCTHIVVELCGRVESGAVEGLVLREECVVLVEESESHALRVDGRREVDVILIEHPVGRVQHLVVVAQNGHRSARRTSRRQQTNTFPHLNCFVVVAR